MTCRIDLSHQEAYYGPGKTIRGRAFCQFVATEEFKVIKCILKGKEKTAWSERRREKNETVTRYYGGENIFLKAEAVFAENGLLPPGQYVYPFAFNLPRNMASTFEGDHGSIKYYLTLLVDKGIISNYTCEMEVIIVSPINFNLMKDQLQLQPTIYQDEKVLCCWCCASGPITMELLFEKEAFVVGEVAHIRVKIVNMSNKTIPHVDMCLKQKIVYKSDVYHSTYKVTELAKANISGVGAHGDRNYLFNFEIPPSANVPNFAGCILFDSQAHFLTEATIPGFHANLRIYTGPIKLGHTPLDGTTAEMFQGQKTDPPPSYTFDVNTNPKETESEKTPFMTDGEASAPTEESSPSAPFLSEKDYEQVDV